jgi:hypothetical protein
VQVTITGPGLKKTLLRIVAIIVLAGIGYGIWLLSRPSDPFAGKVAKGRWQAVFLSDGRIYFGHLHPASSEFFELTEAYFVQQVQGAKGQQAGSQVRPISAQPEGPEDRVMLDRKFILQIENLRTDSEAVKAIEQVRSAGK